MSKRKNNYVASAKVEPEAIEQHRVFCSLPAPFNKNIDALIWNGVTGDKRVDYIISGNLIIDYCSFPKPARRRISFANSAARASSAAAVGHGVILNPPVPISEHKVFGKLPAPFNQQIDGVLFNGQKGANRIDMIFSGDQVVEFCCLGEGLVKSQPVPIAQHRALRMLPEPFNKKIDAVAWNGQPAHMHVDYIFSGHMVVEFNSCPGFSKLISAPVDIAEHEIFSSLPQPFREKGIVVQEILWNGLHGEDRVDYIFCGDQVCEFSGIK